jgi:hypothetical protein
MAQHGGTAMLSEQGAGRRGSYDTGDDDDGP